MTSARTVRVRGVVQGVGFRPFVFRLASAHALGGWVRNGEEGVEIYIEGTDDRVRTFLAHLREQAPPAACITSIDVEPGAPIGVTGFAIQESRREIRPSVRISPDLPVCGECLAELFDPADPRYGYPYINCTDCGPRYSILLGLPYDRQRTTMARWPMDARCAAQFEDPADRRFHAQPVACPGCGPAYVLLHAGERAAGGAAIDRAVKRLNAGDVLAVKGLGGYHLACDARNEESVGRLRARKFRKEKPFALMANTLEVARTIVELSPDAESLLTSAARPIVLAPAREAMPGIAPENGDLGVMLPYTPLHALLFAAGAPDLLVMTSANRSSEPIAYEDDDALERLAGLADGFLIGERPIARRLDDSVARSGAFGTTILRRARGYAPAAVATLPADRPLVALGADLKNAIALVVEGQVYVSQHIGDLEHYASFRAFEEAIRDLTSMYELGLEELIVVHDRHPEYTSTRHALTLGGAETLAVQHHRAHVASVVAEREAWDERVLGVGFDGTGYGDDGTIWGGELFTGSVREGFERVAHLRPAALPGGDAAARHPVQAAAGFLAQVPALPDLEAAPFSFPSRYAQALRIARAGVRTFTTTSVGRLFDAAAALLGFTREATFEGQAAMWVEHLARGASEASAYPFPFTGRELDFRPLLGALAADRADGRAPGESARAFQRGLAAGLVEAARAIGEAAGLRTIVLSGGVFQNELLLEDVLALFEPRPFRIWTNRRVPPNDGGICLGQAALAALGPRGGLS